MKWFALRALLSAIPIITFLIIFIGLTQRWEFSSVAALPFAAGAAIIQGCIMTKKDDHIGGFRLLTRSQALAAARERIRRDYLGAKLFKLWDLLYVPEVFKSKGIFVMGEPGSGKTVFLKYHIYELLKEPNAKLIIHDFKMDLHPFIRWLKEQEEFKDVDMKIFHPWDKRSARLSLQGAVKDEGTAAGIASAVVPDPPPHADPYWTNGARLIIQAALCYFLYRSEEDASFRWGLHELITLMEQKERLQTIINEDDRLSYARTFINRSNDDVLSTAMKELGKLKTIGMMWSHPDNQNDWVDVGRWMREQGRSVLILGTDGRYGEECETFNRTLWMMLYREALDQSRPVLGDISFILDEFYLMGRLYDIEGVSAVSRSRRINLTYVAQSASQILKRYGEKDTDSLMATCGTKIFFRCSSASSADFAVKEIGKQKRMQTGTDVHFDPQGVRHGQSEKEHTESVLMAEDIRRLQLCSSANPVLDAVIMTFIDDPFHWKMEFEAFRHVWPSPEIKEDYQPEDRRERTRHRPLTNEVRRKIGLPEKPQPKKDEAPTSDLKLETGSDLPQFKTYDEYESFEEFVEDFSDEISRTSGIEPRVVEPPKVKPRIIREKDIN
jgi:type IV secretory pathway TraG/TraD family ATPase VirD4